MTIQIHSEGRRHYLRGDTYQIRDRLRSGGCKWDAAARAWWTGKRETAEQLVAELTATAEQPRQQQQSAADRKPRDGMDSIVAGRATYKGRTYYVAGKTGAGRAAWDVEPVRTRDGEKVLLYFRDGSAQFWASWSEVVETREYQRAQTLGSLREYAEQAKQARAEGRERCECGAYHDDDEHGCYLCGCTRCEGAHGGLCQHD